jgi:hypothetical protein
MPLATIGQQHRQPTTLHLCPSPLPTPALNCGPSASQTISQRRSGENRQRQCESPDSLGLCLIRLFRGHPGGIALRRHVGREAPRDSHMVSGAGHVQEVMVGTQPADVLL